MFVDHCRPCPPVQTTQLRSCPGFVFLRNNPMTHAALSSPTRVRLRESGSVREGNGDGWYCNWPGGSHGNAWWIMTRRNRESERRRSLRVTHRRQVDFSYARLLRESSSPRAHLKKESHSRAKRSSRKPTNTLNASKFPSFCHLISLVSYFSFVSLRSVRKSGTEKSRVCQFVHITKYRPLRFLNKLSNHVRFSFW